MFLFYQIQTIVSQHTIEKTLYELCIHQAEHATPEEEGGGGRGGRGSVSVRSTVWDFVGGDLVRPDLGKWLDDVEKHKALAIYPPHEGGYEGRYLNRLRYQGYYFLDLSARGLGDPETTLTKVHLVCSVRSTPLVSFFPCCCCCYGCAVFFRCVREPSGRSTKN